MRRWCPDYFSIPPTNPPHRDLTPALAGLLRTIIREGAAYFRREPDAAEILTSALADVAPKRSPNDERDRFIYESIKKGRSLAQIRQRIDRTTKWLSFDSFQGITQAARRYAKRRNLQWPIR
jgi:hypothetical protein